MEEQDKREAWVFDAADLVPGAELSRDECERLIGRRYWEDPRYGLELVKLASFIDRLIRDDGRLCTIRTVSGGIQILTHSEAARYNADRFESAIDLMRRCKRRLDAVDPAQLDADELRSYDRNRNRQGRTLAAIKTATMADMSLTPSRPSKPPMRARVTLSNTQGKEPKE